MPIIKSCPQSIEIQLPCEPYEVESSRLEGKELHIRFVRCVGPERCPECGEVMHVHENRQVSLRAMPCGEHRIVFWDVETCVYRCPDCGLFKSADIPFRFGRRQCTVHLAKHICFLMERQNMTVSVVSDILGLGWDRVKGIHRDFLSAVSDRLPEPESPALAVVDEFSIERGQSYATLVINGKSKQVLYTAKGKRKEDFEPFFDRYGAKFYDGIEAFAMDQNAQYNEVVRKRLPKAAIVADYFHMLKNYSDQVLDKVRLRAARTCRKEGDMPSYWIWKRSRRLLSTRLGDEASDAGTWCAMQSLETLMRQNKELDTCIHLREELQWMYENCRDGGMMAQKWDQWRDMARASGIPELASFADNKDKFREEIIAHAEHPFSSGVIEGCMNKIKVLKRVAFGFRDWDYFSMRILYCFLPHKVKTEVWNLIWESLGCPDENYTYSPSNTVEQQKAG